MNENEDFTNRNLSLKKVKKVVYITQAQDKLLKYNKQEHGCPEAFLIRQALNVFLKIDESKLEFDDNGDVLPADFMKI